MAESETPSSKTNEAGTLERAAKRTWRAPTVKGMVAKATQMGGTLVATAGVAEVAGLSPRDTVVAAVVAGLAGSKVRGEASEFLDNLHEEQGKPKISETPAPKIRKEKDPDAPPKEPLRTRARAAIRGLFDLNSDENKANKGPNLVSRVGQAAYHRSAELAGAATGVVAGGAAGSVLGQNLSTTAATIAVGAIGGKVAQKAAERKMEKSDMEKAKAAANGISPELGAALRDTAPSAPQEQAGTDKPKGRGGRA